MGALLVIVKPIRRRAVGAGSFRSCWS